MKIYIYRYGSLCEPDIIDAFKRIGLEIVEESAEIYNKSIIPSESAALASSVLTKGGFAFAFTINFFPWLSDICQLLNITYISLIVDSPVLELYSNAISNPVNRIFLFDKMLYEEFEQYNKNMPATYHSSAQPIRKNVHLITLYFPIMKEVLLTELLMHRLVCMVLIL